MFDLDYVKDRLNIKDSEHDGVLSAIEREVVREFSRDTGHWFGKVQTVNEVWSGAGTRHIWLTDTPIVDTLTMYYRLSGSLDWIEFPATAFECLGRRVTIFPELLSDSLLLNATTGWPVGTNSVRAVYQRGFDDYDATEDADNSGAAPDDVQSAILEQIGVKFSQRVTATSGNAALIFSDGPGNAPAIPIATSYKAAVKAWRRPSLGGHNLSIVTIVPES